MPPQSPTVRFRLANAWGLALLLALAGSGCELLVDFDRSRIDEADEPPAAGDAGAMDDMDDASVMDPERDASMASMDDDAGSDPMDGDAAIRDAGATDAGATDAGAAIADAATPDGGSPDAGP